MLARVDQVPVRCCVRIVLMVTPLGLRLSKLDVCFLVALQCRSFGFEGWHTPQALGFVVTLAPLLGDFDSARPVYLGRVGDCLTPVGY